MEVEGVSAYGTLNFLNILNRISNKYTNGDKKNEIMIMFDNTVEQWRCIIETEEKLASGNGDFVEQAVWTALYKLGKVDNTGETVEEETVEDDD